MYLLEAKLIGAGLAAIGLTGAGIGLGIIFGSCLLSTSRNPSLRKELFSLTILGFALTEAIAIFCILIILIILFVM